MYVILIDKDNSMVVTQRQRIIQKSNFVDELWFLTSPTYNGYNMADFNAQLEYILPVSGRYRNETLVRSVDYNNHLKYVLPIDSELTSEAGDIELKISFTLMEQIESRGSIERGRKISPTMVTIVPLESWDDLDTDGEHEAVNVVLI